MAAGAHGASRLTQKVDVAYSRTPANMDRLATALARLAPYLCGAPPRSPFRGDAAALHRELHLALTATLGDLDLSGEIVGGGGFAGLLGHTVELELCGVPRRCLELAGLIRVERAAGRPRDLGALAELEALLEERGS